MPPRIAESFATRVKRASPCPSRNPSSSSCRSTARATSATAISTSAPSTRRRRARNWSCEKLRCSLRIIAICDLRSWVHRRDGFHDAHFVGARNHHAQSDARGLLDATVRSPGALFELQLTPLDLERIALAVEALQLNEAAARLVLGRHDGDCRHAERQRQQRDSHFHCHAHAGRLSATRSTALRARGLAAISSADGWIARPMRWSFARACPGICGRPAYTGSSCECFCMKRLTMPSSSEWN